MGDLKTWAGARPEKNSLCGGADSRRINEKLSKQRKFNGGKNIKKQRLWIL